ncbi:MAG TPA: carboxyltransferase domain-containing protein [Thermoanaerobaculia bacterium]|nr:carboxyltransferase domain-containing protein [Thermoanaerobaculia bacterium]
MHIAPAGDNALLVDLGDVTAAQLHAAASSVRGVKHVVRCTPGHSSLYVVFEATPDRDAVAAAIRTADKGQRTTENEYTVPVSFRGENFAEFVAGKPDFFSRIREVRLQARYLGFRAGFAYLDGWPEAWAMPRRPTSRPVLAGSFAIGGAVAGFYPINSPGGWNILGRTNALPPIVPGDVIAIEPATHALEWTGPAAAAARNPLFSVVAPGEAFDDVADALVRRAVPGATVYECALVWPRLRFERGRVAVICGPDGAVRRLDEVNPARIVGGLRGYIGVGEREDVIASIGRGDRLTIHAIAGPHDIGIGTIECEVTPQLDRVGLRLRPLRAIDAAIPADLRSIGMQCGTVQLHPDGSLVAMGPDHPVTGGYLQPMTVISSERWKLAQLVPGERFSLCISQLPRV